MSKGQLEKIQEKYMEVEYDFNLISCDINWLIKQAERVQELEAQNEGRELAHKLVVHYAKELEQQNTRYREEIEGIKQNTSCPLAQKVAIKILEGEK